MAREREHELIVELRAARRDLATAREAEDEARRIVAEKKTIRVKYELLVEEILEEVTTGRRRDSLIEYAESNGRAAEPDRPDTADERQRGPTERTTITARGRTVVVSTAAVPAEPRSFIISKSRRGGGFAYGGSVDAVNHESALVVARIKFGTGDYSAGILDSAGVLDDDAKAEPNRTAVVPQPAAKSEQRTAEAPVFDDAIEEAEGYGVGFGSEYDEEPKTTVADDYADSALAAACWPEHAKPDWAKYRRFGSISDCEVMAVLASIWPEGRVYTADGDSDDEPGWTTFGGAAPVFWIGDKTKPGIRPIGLHGPELYDAVRRVLRIPAVRRVLRIPAPGGVPKLPSLADGSTIAEIVEHDQSVRKPAKKSRKPKPAADDA